MKRFLGQRTGRVLAGVALLLGTGASVFADGQDFKIVQLDSGYPKNGTRGDEKGG